MKHLLILCLLSWTLSGCVTLVVSRDPASGSTSGSGTGARDLLRVGVISDITAMDPHYSFMDLNLQVQGMVYDTLVAYGPNKELIPNLAKSWKVSPTDPNVWIFELRNDVRFHDQQPFTKKDVLATLDRVRAYAPHAPTGYFGQLNALDLDKTRAASEKDPNPYRLTVVTKQPYGFVPSAVANIYIMAEKQAREAMALDASDATAAGKSLSAKVLEAFSSGALVNGTGPYRFKAWHKFSEDPVSSKVVLESVDRDWQPGRSPWKTLEIIGEPRDDKRVERLLSCDFDIIANTPNTRLADLRSANYQIIQGPSQRMVHLQMYQGADGREKDPAHIPLKDESGNAYPSPFKSLLVRQAFYAALDKARLVQVMSGQALPTGQFMLPGRPGYLQDQATSAFDVTRARALLAQASQDPELDFLRDKKLVLTVHGPNDRYPNDARILEEVAKMWNEAFGDFTVEGRHFSIRTVAKSEPKATYFPNVRKYNVLLLGGGIDNGHIEGGLRLYLLPNSGLNYTSYQNPQVTALYNQGVGEIDEAKRDALLTRAGQKAVEDLAVLPLYNQMGVFGVRQGLDFQYRIDEVLYPNVVREKSDVARPGVGLSCRKVF